jgi:hypothetical protein
MNERRRNSWATWTLVSLLTTLLGYLGGYFLASDSAPAGRVFHSRLAFRAYTPLWRIEEAIRGGERIWIEVDH